MKDPLLQLTSTIATHLAQLTTADVEIRDSLVHLLASIQFARPQAHRANPHAYAPLVQRAIETGRDDRGREILERLAPIHASLSWVYSYLPPSPADELGDHIAFAELVGPDGPLWAPSCRVGFTVLAERTTYPPHCHPAIELYFVLAGVAQWITPTADRSVPPGELVLHRSGESHAMRTYNEPLLALWGWRGDIDSPAVYV